MLKLIISRMVTIIFLGLNGKFEAIPKIFLRIFSFAFLPKLESHFFYFSRRPDRPMRGRLLHNILPSQPNHLRSRRPQRLTLRQEEIPQATAIHQASDEHDKQASLTAIKTCNPSIQQTTTAQKASGYHTPGHDLVIACQASLPTSTEY